MKNRIHFYMKIAQKYHSNQSVPLDHPIYFLTVVHKELHHDFVKKVIERQNAEIFHEIT